MLSKLLYETNIQHRMETEPETLSNNNSHVEENNIIKYGSLPYIRNLTNEIKNCFKNENIKIPTYNVKTISTLYSKLKDRTPKLLKSNIIYKIKCTECESTYVGQTAQWLKSRLALHKSDITKRKLRCALALHLLEKNHKIDFESTEILEVNGKYNKRLILQMINIRRQTNPINRKNDEKRS
ncbi:hypothetical protein WA026_020769 [Henosepilachna vigintioctopunctata]|uniref:GIY-YIG domain-containing protein n=1 Tax=Henosepilachna vigintioctopunctata TaxID=420089 RepID=A0AAW1TYT2_9CUCU